MAIDNLTHIIMDRAIALHLQHIVLLKRRRNAASSVSVLPRELLGRIFCECASIETQDLQGTGKGRRLPACVRLSHVSHDWRALALGFPELWSIIQVRTTTRNSLLRHMWFHSQHVLLSLYFCSFNSTSSSESLKTMDRAAKMVHKYPGRWKSFTFYSDRISLERAFHHFTGTFKNLRSLTVVGRGVSTGDLGSLLTFSAPNLRSIKLVPYFSLPITSPLLQGHPSRLTSLEATLKFDQQSISAPFDPFAFLRLANNIQRLVIRQVHLSDGAAQIPVLTSLLAGLPVVHLPSLEYLELPRSMPLNLQRALLCALRMPKARFHVTIPSHVRGAGHLALLTDLVNSLGLGPHGVLEPQEMLVSWDNIMIWKERVVSPRQWRDTSPSGSRLEAFAQAREPWITFGLPGRLLDPSFVNKLSNYGTGLSLSNLRAVHINMVVPKRLWKALSTLETLESLKVWSASEGQSGLLLRALAGPSSPSNDWERPFPALSTLLCAVPSSYGSRRKINVDETFGDVSEDGNMYLDLVDSLQSNWEFSLDVRDALVKKGQRAKPLKLLEFTECMARVIPEKLGSFYEITSKVVWECQLGVQSDEGRM